MLAKGRARDQKDEKGSNVEISATDAGAIPSDARPYQVIGRDYGIAASAIGRIRQRKSWQAIIIQ